MLDLCRIIFWIVVDLIRPRAALEAEILVLRQQIIVLRRGRPSRLSFLTVDKVVSYRRQGRSGLGLLPVSEGPRRARHRSTPDRGQMAPCWLPIVLALEVQASSGPSRGAS
jgi:hypothetical protein